jgi:phenylalanyl-tRNA synthetase beta chain
VLGVELSWSEIEKHLVAIGATVVSKPDDGRIAVDVPWWRPDITGEIDLIEEIARLYGYDRIPTDLGAFRPGLREDDPAWGAMERIRLGLAAHGLCEVVTLPMVAAAGLGAPRVLNPLTAEHGVLRDALLPSLLRQVEANWAMQTADIRLFEVGAVFEHASDDGVPSETLCAAFVVTGARAPAHWTDGGAPRTWDRWDALGLFQRMIDLAHPAATIQVEEAQWIARDATGAIVGRCGRCVADAPPWATAVFGGEIVVVVHGMTTPAFRPLPVYPAAIRDLSLLVKVDQALAVVTRLVTDRGTRHGLESVSVIDEYRGNALPAGTRSITVRLVFRSAERTLTDSEVEQAIVRLRTSLERELDVTIRST